MICLCRVREAGWRRLRRLMAQERGTVTIMTALVMTAFLGMLALVVDTGYGYGQRRMAQNVADSGAVAAAGTIGLDLAGAGRTDADVAAAVRDVARNTSGGYASSYTALYVDAGGNALSPAVSVGGAPGNDIPAAAQGVAAAPRKTYGSFFGRALGVSTLSAGATATAVTQVVSGVDQNTTDYAPYAVWAGNAVHGCADGSSAPLCVGDDVAYRSNAYKDDNVVPSDNPNWEGTSNDFKGFLHKGTGFLNIGEHATDGGNALGEEPLEMMQSRFAAGQTVILPVVDHEWGNGGLELRVVGFVAVLLTNEPTLPASDAWRGRVVARNVTTGAVTGGTPPPSWLPSLRYSRLVK